MQLNLTLPCIPTSFVGGFARSFVAALLGVTTAVGTSLTASAAPAYDDCAVRILMGHTYIFASLDDPTASTDQLLWSACSEMVRTGVAVSIPTSTPMASAGNQLVCSADSGPAHMHVWASPDSFSIGVATNICNQVPLDNVTWWPLI